MRKALILALFSILITGCGSFKTQTTTFHAPNYKPNGRLAVVARDSVTNNLEFYSYKTKFETELSKHGYTIVQNPKEANFIAAISYEIIGGRNSITSNPIYDSTGKPISSNIIATTNYTRILSMKIISIGEAGETKTIFESSARSVGRCGVLNKVFDPILKAMFKGFPSNNGQTKTVYDTVRLGC